MSTRTVSVKTFNNNKHHHHSNNVSPPPNHVTSLKPTNKKQPKKNQPKLQATNNNVKQNNPKKRRQTKKASSGHTSEDDTSSSASSSEDDMSPTNRRNSNKRQSFEYKSLVDQVYAGPTFNNAPAPSALPIPAFNARGSPINYHPTIYHPVNPFFQQQSMDLMNLITAQKVVTATELEQTNLALSEIQRGLRSMLKIES
ncbi:hypothetical protein EDC96DRAFT_530192 [Choanephora cucurbitarum]|nr:hypothetical protein EDC96DRAFT_530192 [Choanephora cucurbitarum]